MKDESLICQNCLLEEHLGGSHEIISSEAMISSELLKSDASRCLEKVQENINSIMTYHDSVQDRFGKQREDLISNTKELIFEIQSQLDEHLLNYDSLMKSEKEKIDYEVEKL